MLYSFRLTCRYGALFTLGLLSLSCTSTRVGSGPSSDPQFDWFLYEGRDPVFEEVQAGANEYLNPILAGFYPDPSIVRAGDDYYLVTSTFSWFPGLPVFHSRDLVNWTQIGHVLDRPSQLNLDGLEISEGLFAPTIRYHEGTFYVVCTLVGAGGNFVVTATNPAGPWSDPVWLPFDGIDPSIFFDDDGRAYVTNNGPPAEPPRYEGHRAIWIQEFDPDSLRLTGERSLIVNGGVDLSQEPIWIEAPHIFKVNGVYYLIAAEGGTGDQHSEVVFRSDDPRGPWLPYENNPILTQRHLPDDRPYPITSTGHADFVQTPAGDWWAVFLGTRPYENGLYNTGRETFLLPVRWDDGWPIILEGDAAVPYVHSAPDLPSQSPPPVPHNGNFTHRDDFEQPTLAPYWNVIRTPREAWFDLSTAPGRLTLEARPVSIGERGQPSVVGRRQQHAYFTAETKMLYRPVRAGDRAGMVAFQNDDHYFSMYVTQEDDALWVRVERQAGLGAPAEVLVSKPIEPGPDDATYLRIEGEGGAYHFYYGPEEEVWIPLLEGADGRILSTREAGGFVGTYVGVFAASAE